MGEFALGKIAKELARHIGNDSPNHTENSFCTSGSVHLADAGTLVSCLQTTENWKGATTSMECAEHTSKTCKDCMNTLGGDYFAVSPKKQKLSDYAN